MKLVIKKSTMPSLCVVELNVAVNNVKLLTVSMGKKCVPFALLLIYKIFRTAVYIA
jgi:hypothetical protein